MGITLDEVILDASSSSVAISDGTNTLAIDASGNLTANIAGSVDVTGSTVALDAASLAALENITVTVDNSEIEISNDSGNPIPVSGTVALDAPTLAALEDITVSATDLDIRDLSASQDSVRLGDGTDFLEVNSDGSLNVQTQTYAAGQSSQASVGTTAVEVLATPLAGRRELTIQNEGSQPVYFGFTSGVTAANGIKISKNSSATYMIPEAVDVFMIAASGTQDVRFIELG